MLFIPNHKSGGLVLNDEKIYLLRTALMTAKKGILTVLSQNTPTESKTSLSQISYHTLKCTYVKTPPLEGPYISVLIRDLFEAIFFAI